jgi:tetratricopeptide (TPR) repeat protein
LQDKAISCFAKLIALNFTEKEPEKSNIYFEQALLKKNYLKDTAGALSVIGLGRKKYPEAANLAREEANLLILMNKQDEAAKLLEQALIKNEGDSNLHLVLATAYENLAFAKDSSGGTKAQTAKQEEYLTKAEENYRRAIDLKPDYFEAFYNLGALFFNQAAELMNNANSFKNDTEFKYHKLRADDKLKQALPYLEKALELSPGDKNTLVSLKQIYIRMGDTEKYKKVKSALDKI